MLKVQEFIAQNGLHALNDQHIVLREYADRVVLNYSQIFSPKFDSIVRECRGLILSIPDYSIMSIPFFRFYNYGEDQESSSFDVLSASVFEKLDGSLMTVYHDGHDWVVSSRSMAFAEGETGVSGTRFNEIFKSALGCSVKEMFADQDTDLNFIFEMVSPHNRILKQYDTGVYLLSVRNRNTLVEYWKHDDIQSWVNEIRYKHSSMYVPQVFNFNTIEDIVNYHKNNFSYIDEGHVMALDVHGVSPWRIKIKNPAYLAAVHMRENGKLSIRRMLTMIFMNEYEEYLSVFEMDRPIFQPYIDAFNRLRVDINDVYEQVKHIKDRKELALTVRNFSCANVVLALIDGHELDSVFDRMSRNYKSRLLDKYM